MTKGSIHQEDTAIINIPPKNSLLLLSNFSCVRLCATPETAAHQAPLSLGFSRQQHEWVAISFSNAWKWSHSVVSDPQRPHGLQPTRLLRPWDFPGKSIRVGCHCLLQKQSKIHETKTHRNKARNRQLNKSWRLSCFSFNNGYSNKAED